MLDDLRALAEFAQVGSVARAADRLHALIWLAVKYDASLTTTPDRAFADYELPLKPLAGSRSATAI